MRLTVCLFCMFLSASCASKPKDATSVDVTDAQAFYSAQNLLVLEKFDEAAKAYDHVDREYPYSPLAPRAMMMAAFSAYLDYSYDDAIFMADRFIQLHPGNKYTPYMYYLKAVGLYAQISDIARDQAMTQDAMTALREVATRFPKTDYAEDAKLKIRFTIDHMAAKEMAIGREYLYGGQYGSALERFSTVIDKYQTTVYSREALYRLVEIYTILGLSEEARKTAAILGANDIGCEWYAKAYRLVKN